jgi:hypothetical protein
MFPIGIKAYHIMPADFPSEPQDSNPPGLATATPLPNRKANESQPNHLSSPEASRSASFLEQTAVVEMVD